MTLADSGLSTPNGSTSPEEALAYYKSQYEQLELELTEFQASSRELEAELEKDVEASEKRERQLQEKVESLGFEVEEWKVSRLLPRTLGPHPDGRLPAQRTLKVIVFTDKGIYADKI